MSIFQGIWIPIVTPFIGEDSALDLAGAARLTSHLISHGVDGLIVGATTGESATLSLDEHDQLLATVLATTAGRCPVMVGISGSSTAEVVETIRHYNQVAGIAGFLMSAPAYVRPSQDGIRLHFEAAARATHLPIAIYNIAYRTGVNIDVATLQQLSRNPQFVAVKESGNGNVPQLYSQINHTTLNIMSGEDNMIFICSCLGGQGAISAAAHIRPDLYRQMHAYVQQGRLAEARQINDLLQPLIQVLFSEPNPAPVKAALASLGLISDQLRLPMTAASAECKARLAAVLPAVLAFKTT